MSRTRALIRRGRSASGAVAAQLVQALTALVLQLVVVRALGAEGLGVFGLIYSGVILATAITSGLVGDSLTVLDRSRPTVRGGLQLVGVTVAVLAGGILAGVSSVTGLLSWRVALVLGAGMGVFVIEDLLRRLLMACLQFWKVVVVDATVLTATIGWLALTATTRSIRMADIMLTLLVAQIIGTLVAVRLLPGSERWLAPWRRVDVSAVFRFGSWRAAQQGVRPATLTATRIVVVAAAGTAVFGELEAARVYTAPTLLLVTGVAGFLFASYAADTESSLAAKTHRADIGAIALVVMVLLAGFVATAASPWAGRFVTGNAFSLDEVAVFGWVVYAATSGVLIPYGSLASVSGMHVRVFLLRVADAVASVVAVAMLLFVFDASVSWAPYALSVGAIGLAVIIRRHLVVQDVDPADPLAEDLSA